MGPLDDPTQYVDTADKLWEHNLGTIGVDHIILVCNGRYYINNLEREKEQRFTRVRIDLK